MVRKPTVIERVGGHLKRHGLTYILAGSALGAGLAGASAAYDMGLSEGFQTGTKHWGSRPVRSVGVGSDAPVTRDVGVGGSIMTHDVGVGGSIPPVTRDFGVGGRSIITHDVGVGGYIPPVTRDFGQSVYPHDNHRRGVPMVLRER